jgi:hypothetical protein
VDGSRLNNLEERGSRLKRPRLDAELIYDRLGTGLIESHQAMYTQRCNFYKSGDAVWMRGESVFILVK